MSDDAYREFAKDGIDTVLAAADRREDVADVRGAAVLRDRRRSTATAAWPPLGSRLDIIEHERSLPGDRIYYLALPSSLFVPTVKQLQKARFVSRGDGSRTRGIVVEKPIGTDLKSACAINDAIAEVFDERQIYRIDHYLGKETVQNILVLRFANSIFEPLFNQKYVDHVQITVAEEEGVGTRAGYYEQAGALRDMVQNHMLQLLSLVAMEPPHSLDADVVRDEKLEVLQSLRPLRRRDDRRQRRRARQYRAATAKEPGVDPKSRTETLRRAAGVHRQLALVRRAVLPADRQAAAEARQRNLDPPEGGAADPVQHRTRRAARAEHPGDSHSAGRRLLARHQLQAARSARARSSR